MSDRGLIRAGLHSQASAALLELERLRRAGGPVPPGVRQAWRLHKLTGRVPAQLPRLTRLPKRIRLTDPLSPTGYRTIEPVATSPAVIETAAGPVALTPEKILRGYLTQRRKLPQYRALAAANQRTLDRVERRLSALQARKRTLSPPLRAALRRLGSDYAERREAQQELSQTIDEANRIVVEREARASEEEGVGVLFLAWPLAVIISSLALGGAAVYHENQSTQRLEDQVAAVEKGVLPSSAFSTAGLFGQVTDALKALGPVLAIGGGLWFLASRRRKSA